MLHVSARSKRGAACRIVGIALLAINTAPGSATPPVASGSVAAKSSESSSVNVKYPPDGARNVSIAQAKVPNLGEVEFRATRSGTRVVVDAYALGGGLVGRAEIVIGLETTPIYLKTATGLVPLDLRWH